jgi:hypothetical protein
MVDKPVAFVTKTTGHATPLRNLLAQPPFHTRFQSLKRTRETAFAAAVDANQHVQIRRQLHGAPPKLKQLTRRTALIIASHFSRPHGLLRKHTPSLPYPAVTSSTPSSRWPVWVPWLVMVRP